VVPARSGAPNPEPLEAPITETTPPPPSEPTSLEQFGIERIGLAFAQRPDVTAALARAVTCEQATAAHDALWALGRGTTASTLRAAHHMACGGLHDWRIERGLPWDEPVTAARTLAAVATAPGVVEQVATAWLSPPGELRLVLLGLGCRDEAARWTAACESADAVWFAAHGYDEEPLA